jgi:hypothetical protein
LGQTTGEGPWRLSGDQDVLLVAPTVDGVHVPERGERAVARAYSCRGIRA